jgi:K+-sensing histidine kinase KdpD
MKLELAPDSIIVLGDGIQLQQVILNLVMNGIEAMTNVTDRPRTLILHSESRNRGQIRVAVQDSGNGLSEEVMGRLFEPFFTTRTKGMGMGLPISRSIVEAHGGRLWAESNGSAGATFQFTLPIPDGALLMKNQDPIVFVIDDDRMIWLRREEAILSTALIHPGAEAGTAEGVCLHISRQVAGLSS